MLIDDWRTVLRRAWSIRLLAVAGLLSGLEAAVPFLDGILPIPRGTFAVLAFLATGGAFVARLVAQKSMYEEDQDNG